MVSTGPPRPQRRLRVHRVRRLPGERVGRLLLLHGLLARDDSAPRAPFHAARGALARLQAEADHRRETQERMGGKPLRYTGVIFCPRGLDPAVGAGAPRRRGWRRRRGWARRWELCREWLGPRAWPGPWSGPTAGCGCARRRGSARGWARRRSGPPFRFLGFGCCVRSLVRRCLLSSCRCSHPIIL